MIGGALMCTLAGWPLAAGLVVESLDNTRKGYPTPLPPWVEYGSRFILGLFAFLIDFLYFILPFFLGGLLFFCVGMFTIIGNAADQVQIGTGYGFYIILGVIALMFLTGVSPVGRLMFVSDGRPENAMSFKALRETLRPGAFLTYFRARLLSLPAYLPAVVLIGLIVLVLPSSLPFSWLIGLVLIWLAMSAILYAHLITIQIYAGAERELEERGMAREPE